jgi:hypothetical protein
LSLFHTEFSDSSYLFCIFTIQIYIVRANEFTTADGAVSLMNLEVWKKGKLLSKSGQYFLFWHPGYVMHQNELIVVSP